METPHELQPCEASQRDFTGAFTWGKPTQVYRKQYILTFVFKVIKCYLQPIGIPQSADLPNNLQKVLIIIMLCLE